MKLKLALVSATALTIVGGLAYAQSNGTTTNQDGTKNQILVDQSAAENGKTGTLTQAGSGNDISVTQAGIGHLANGVQDGAGNVMVFDQKGLELRDAVGLTGGLIHDVKQTSSDDARVPTTNVVRIEQIATSTGETPNTIVYHVDQTHDGLGAPNVVDIKQEDSRNKIGVLDQSGIVQTGSGNELTVVQAGSNNLIPATLQDGRDNSGLISQTGSSGVINQAQQIGAENSFEIRQSGRSMAFASLRQEGDGNSARIDQNSSGINGATISVLGDRSTTNISQSGSTTTANIDIIGGYDNVVTLDQSNSYSGGLDVDLTDSDWNTIDGLQRNGTGTVRLTDSDGNDIGIDQSDPGAIGTIALMQSDDNTVSLRQNGRVRGTINLTNADDNVVRLNQNGWGGSVAGLTIDGGTGTASGNVLNATQNGDGHTLSVNITGKLSDDNNDTAVTGNSFDDTAAATVRDMVRGQNGLANFGEGSLYQAGIDNSVVLEINGEGNAFATYQSGRDNTVVGTVTGEMNQAIVSQVGTGHSATFTQSGYGNVVAIAQ